MQGHPSQSERVDLFEVRIHGRGGQGVVTAAELLSVAAFLEGRHAQAFPSFGSERTGAPVVAYCRIGDQPIRTREPITQPLAVIIADPTLLHQVPVFEGLQPEGYLLVNSSKSFDQLGLGEFVEQFSRHRLMVVPATVYAVQLVGRPVPNAALLGGFAALTGLVSLESVTSAIRGRFPRALAEPNVRAAGRAFEFVCAERGQLQRA